MNRSELTKRIGELQAEEPLLVYEGMLGTNPHNLGRIEFVYKPHSSLVFSMGTTLPYAMSMRLVLPIIGSSTRGFVVDTTPGSEEDQFILHGIVLEDVEYGVENDVSRVTFFVLNFHCFKDAFGEPDEKAYTYDCGEWTVSLSMLPNAADRLKQAKNREGYAFTHAAELRRKDGMSFRPGDALDFLSFLELSFGYLRGGRSACVLPAGFADGDTPVWERWEVTSNTSPIDYNGTWFIATQPGSCFNVISRAYDLWQDNSRRGWYSLALKLYVGANRNTSGTELALSNAQTLLELLCWIALVEENNITTAQALDGQSAGARIFDLLHWARIPPSIPRHLEQIKKAASILNTSDGPTTAAALRNKITHPTRKNLEKLDGIHVMAYYEAWQLCMWYSELVMLRLFDYTGMYNNRLRDGAIGSAERVPWAPRQSTIT